MFEMNFKNFFVILHMICVFCLNLNKAQLISSLTKNVPVLGDNLNTDKLESQVVNPYAVPSIDNLGFGNPLQALQAPITNGPTVQTGIGTVMGQIIPMLGQNIEQYLGIPYAVPPIGNLRFAKPQPILTPIQGIIDGTRPKASCPQTYIPPVVPTFAGVTEKSEDCLTLNIWTQQYKSPGYLKPVMFWIYGGALFLGSITQTAYNGSVLATNDVVVVSVNYRLGQFGFLYGGDESAPGNVGFFDQNLGLQWVRENIHLFGGDKNQITIFGESAGSWSVAAHLLSPVSKGLFRRAIVMSGVYLFSKYRPVFSKEEALQNAKQLAKTFGCFDDNNWLQCLRAQNVNDPRWYSLDIVYPVVDTEFLPLMARTALEQGQFNKGLDILAGYTKNEGTILLFLIAKEFLLVPVYNPSVFDYYLDKLNGIFHNIDKPLQEQLKNYYLANIDWNNSTAVKEKIFEFTTDFAMKCPTYRFAKLYAQHSTPETNVFFYELTHKIYDFLPVFQNTLLDKFKLDPLSPINNAFGVFHSSDVPLLFGSPFLKPNSATPVDTQFSIEYMKLFTDFVKYGKPDPNWPKLVATDAPGSDQIRNLNPRPQYLYSTNSMEQTCDSLRKDYF